MFGDGAASRVDGGVVATGGTDPTKGLARQEYLDREVAADATPLHLHPSETIEGEHGLVRSVILNDRMRALTVDTAGQVAVWDVLRGSCVGGFGGAS